tara:strand:+ start:638 stop:844 length:207 start_codon:yes stop_codon:yes gene_type:complete
MYHTVRNTNDNTTLYLTTTNLIDLYGSMLENPTKDELFNRVIAVTGTEAFSQMLDEIYNEYGLRVAYN